MPSYKVIISPSAESDYFKITAWIEEKWSLKEVQNFYMQFDEAFIKISLNPLAFEAYKKKNVRKFVIDKHNVIFYRLHKGVIEVIAIWASKRHPKKLKI